MLLGILLLVLVGSTWALVGVIMGHAPKRGIDTGILLGFSALIPFSISSALFLTGIAAPFTGSPRTALAAGAFYAAGGALNFIMLQIMSVAMQRGPNGIVWAIIQSGLIFPFSMGMLFFNVPFSAARLAGIAALLISLVLFGLTKPNRQTTARNWLLPTVLAFLLCGIQQMLMNLPSYFPEVRDGVSAYFRTFSVSIGAMAMFVVVNVVVKRRSAFGTRFLATIRQAIFWEYVLVKQGFGLVSSFFLIYQGMDRLSAAGIGSASYPLLVGSCIVSFTLYARWVLKERNGRLQALGLVLCVSGIILICVK